MTTKSEIESLISNAKELSRKYKNIIAECDKQIARLEPVYQKLGEIKDDFRSAKKSTEVVFEEKRIWRGNKYASFCAAGEALDGAYGEYYKQIDAAQDAVNRKIGELRAKKWELTPLLGSLAKEIERWRVEIQNNLN